jgi:hypothetical protein
VEEKKKTRKVAIFNAQNVQNQLGKEYAKTW